MICYYLNTYCRKVLYCTCCVLLFTSCVMEKKNLNINKVPTIEIPVDKDDIPNMFSSFFKMSHYVSLETTEESLIRQVEKVVLTDNKIYILDRLEYQILVFNSSGKFLHKIKMLGQGPGEYVNLSDFSVKGDTIYLLDRMAGKLLIYKNNFLISEFPTERARSFSVVKHGDYAFNMELGTAVNGNKNGDSYAFYKDNNLLLRGIGYNKNLRGLSFTQSEGHNGFYCYSDSIFANFPFNDTIYTVNKRDGSLSPYYCFKTGNDKIELDSSIQEIEELRKKGIVTSIFCFYKLENYMLFSYYYGDKRKYTIADTGGRILFNGSFKFDENGFLVRATPYDSNRTCNKLMSIVYPSELLSIAENKKDASDIMVRLADSVKIEDNPILVFYNWIYDKTAL